MILAHGRRLGQLLLVAAIGLVAATGAGAPPEAAAAAAKKKLAMILPGSIQDADFNTVGYLALQELGKTYDLQVSHSESVAVADAERITREYLTAGYDIVIFHGGQYAAIVNKLAPAFPNAQFVNNTSGRVPNAPPNVWILGRRWYQGFYVLGALGALSTKGHKVGFIGGVRIPDVIASTNSVQQALKDYNPKAQLIYNHIGDFNDPVKARQTTEAQVNAGVDFIVNFINLGIYGVAEAVKAQPKPVLLTTFVTEKWELAPRHLVGSLLADYPKAYREIAGKVLQGERTGYWEMRPGNGFELSDLRNIPPEVAAKVKAIFADVVSGKVQIAEVTDRIVAP